MDEKVEFIFINSMTILELNASFEIFKKFLLLFNYSCMPFLPIPPPHPS